jgi:hypothetical protein
MIMKCVVGGEPPALSTEERRELTSVIALPMPTLSDFDVESIAERFWRTIVHTVANTTRALLIGLVACGASPHTHGIHVIHRLASVPVSMAAFLGAVT